MSRDNFVQEGFFCISALPRRSAGRSTLNNGEGRSARRHHSPCTTSTSVVWWVALEEQVARLQQLQLRTAAAASVTSTASCSSASLPLDNIADHNLPATETRHPGTSVNQFVVCCC